jgi:hypothetical protein
VEVLYPSPSWDLLFLDYDDLLLYQTSSCHLSLLYDEEDGERPYATFLARVHHVQVDHPSFLFHQEGHPSSYHLVRLDPFDQQAQSFVVS